MGAWELAAFGARDAVDQVLHRSVRASMISRITHSLSDKPNVAALPGKSTRPDSWSPIDELAHRGSAHMIVDGITAANDI